MSKKRHAYPKSIQDAKAVQKGPAYVSWEDNQESAFSTYSDALEEASHTVSNYRRDYRGLTDNIDGRPGLAPGDFDWFRPGQAAPVKPKDIIAYGRFVYRRIGIIHNAIDLMGDFAGQGIRVVHPNPTIEKFMNSWFSNVGGTKVTERLGHLLFREANVPIRMFSARIDKSKRLEMQRSVGEVDIKMERGTKVAKNEIPWRYNFIDPLLVEPIGGPLASLSDNKLLSLKVPHHLKREIQRILDSQNPEIRETIKHISPDIIKAVQSNSNIILPPDKTYLYHYKKDDWQTWADPMTYSAFEPLNLYQRLQLADKAALDGAISKIRVWKIGSLEHKLAPTPTTSATLADMLGANVGGGTIDIIWGPDIELIETSSDLQSFLGEEKYRPTLMAIYATLGIPPTLTGTFGASGTTNNFISLKTLTERLNYVRNIIVEFWSEQLRLVQKAMGFRLPAEIEFDYMYLDDPTAVATLLGNMADRNIVSDEFVQRNLKAKPSIENRRIKNESKKREASGMEKVSPYHEVDKEHSLKKIALQSGITSPSEVGLELKPKKGGEKSAMEMKEQQMKIGRPPGSSPAGTPGRPKNTRDSTKRKEKTFKPKTKASLELWAKDAQEKISEILNPRVVANFGKTSLRGLSADQSGQLEKLKFEVLCNLEVGCEVTPFVVAEASQIPNPEIHKNFEEWTGQALELVDKTALTIDDVRGLRVSFFVDHQLER